MKSFLLFVGLLLLGGCGEDAVGPSHVPCDPFLLEFGVAAGDTITTSSGVEYIEVRYGEGDPASSSSIADVNYSLYLLDGTPIETTCSANRPVFRFAVGGGGVIAGFRIGVTGMQPGGIRRIIVPPELGYGDATLIFDLEMVRVSGF